MPRRRAYKLSLAAFVVLTVVWIGSGWGAVWYSTGTTAVGILPGTIAFTASGSAVAWLYTMHPGAVTVGVVTVGAFFLIAVWWRYRGAPAPSPTDV